VDGHRDTFTHNYQENERHDLQYGDVSRQVRIFKTPSGAEYYKTIHYKIDYKTDAKRSHMDYSQETETQSLLPPLNDQDFISEIHFLFATKYINKLAQKRLEASMVWSTIAQEGVCRP
jgi:hypothetical protein